MKTTIDPQQLALFVAVVEKGGFTAAAQHLNTDKGYVSRSVSRIEDQLGVPLLNRTTRSVTTTQAGMVLHEQAIRVLHALNEVENEVRSAAQEPSGTFRITTAPEFGRQRANAWFQELLRRHPGLSIDVVYVNHPVDLLADRIDVAIRLGGNGPPELITTKVGTIHYGIYAAPSYLADRPEITNERDLEKHDLIVFSPQGEKGIEASWSGRKQYATIKLWKEDELHEVGMFTRFRSNNVFATRQMCAAGFGIAIIPIEVAELVEPPALEKLDLVRLLPGCAIEETSINLIYPPSSRNDPRVRSLIEVARESFRQRQAP